MASEIYIHCVTDEQDFLSLQKDWNRLLAECSLDSVFLRHEWFEAAWQWLRLDATLHVICAYRNGNLVGICPLVRRRRFTGLYRFRVLEFLTVPDSQIVELISSRADRVDFVEALVTHLYLIRNDWDLLQLNKLSADSHTVTAIPKALCARGFLTEIRDDGVNPCIDLTDNWESYYGRRSRRLKKGNNLVRNRLNRTYQNIELRKYSRHIPDSKEADRFIEQLVSISMKSWKQETGLTLEQPGPNAFIRTLTAHALTEGWLSVWLLYLNGQPVAMEYQLNYYGNVYALRADFDKSYNEWSPGTFMNVELLKALFSGDSRRYFMGPGENPYKLRWAEEFEPLIKIVAYSTNVKASLFGFAHLKIVPWIKGYLQRKQVDNNGESQ